MGDRRRRATCRGSNGPWSACSPVPPAEQAESKGSEAKRPSCRVTLARAPGVGQSVEKLRQSRRTLGCVHVLSSRPVLDDRVQPQAAVAMITDLAIVTRA